MELILQRIKDNGNATTGKLLIDFIYFCDTLEDEQRDIKVKGETRIPEGTYEIKKRMVLSGLTKKYQKRFNWFDYHLMIQDVPNFNYVYIHVGNTEKHTDGCIIVGKDTGEFTLKDSVKTFWPLYNKVSEALDSGERVTITIQEEL